MMAAVDDKKGQKLIQQSTYLGEPLRGIRWWLQLLLIQLLQKGGELAIGFLELCIDEAGVED